MRGPRLAVGLLLFVIGGGTAGYALIEHWSLWDAFFMTITTVSTVGYREVHPLSFAGQVFTAGLILAGVGTLFYTATLIVTAVVEGGLHRRFKHRRLTRMLEKITDHYIVCGYGRIGGLIAHELHLQGMPFVIIERDAGRVRRAEERGWLAVEADASREDVLTRVGIQRARGLIAAVGTDAENVYTVLTARVMRPDLFIIARVEADDAETKLRRAGADRVISPYYIGANHMVQTALRPAVVDFVEFATSSEHLDLSMEQVEVPDGCAIAGKTIVDAGIRQNFGVIIVSIKRAGGTMEFNPEPDAIIRGGDQLVVLGRTERVKALEETIHQ